MLDASILEKLTLVLADETPIETLDQHERYIYSVMNHIERILNTRRGSVKYIPDYGLPDLSVIYRHLPGSLLVLQHHISFTLLKYEPRLVAVQVKMIEAQSTDFMIAYELLCQLKGIGSVRFTTTFDGHEMVRVWRE
ncbi:type VI secretion system baseplate subunit TssE [Neisseriaceae bacterium ESL0693]|nr:type VI secretion system baseplate subunit TssE [Neisseriaceae bacterium ESL0693]